MSTVNRKLTLCEVLRQINDTHQGDTEHDKQTRAMLCTAEHMAKRMAHKLYEYKKDFDKGWWEENKQYDEAMKKRLNEKYCTGWKWNTWLLQRLYLI